MDMAAGIVILAILLLGLLLVGGVALVVVLLVNPRTRPVGIVLAVLGGLFVCAVVVGVGFLFLSRGAAVHTEGMRAMEAQRMEAEAAARLEQMRKDLVGTPVPLAVPEPGIETPLSETPEPKVPTTITPPETPPAEQPTSEQSALEQPAVGEFAEHSRPSWVESPPKRAGDGYQMSITVGPYTSRMECDAELPKALQAALDEYVSIYMGPQWAGRIRLPAEVLERQLVKDRWEETIQASVGPMVQLHVLLDFDSKFRQTVCEMRDQSIVAGRLWVAGTGLGVVLAWLALAFVFLRIDQATAGAYRGRLAVGCFLGAVAVLLAAGVVLKAAGPVVLVLEHLPAAIESEQLPPTLDGVLHNSAESHARSHLGAGAGATGPRAPGHLSVLALLVGVGALAGLVVLLAFRRTRVIGIVLLAAGVIGALFLVA